MLICSRKYNELEFTLTGNEEAGSSLVREFLQQPSMRYQLRQKSTAGFLDLKDVPPVFLSLKNDDNVVLTFVLFKGYGTCHAVDLPHLSISTPRPP